MLGLAQPGLHQKMTVTSGRFILKGWRLWWERNCYHRITRWFTIQTRRRRLRRKIYWKPRIHKWCKFSYNFFRGDSILTHFTNFASLYVKLQLHHIIVKSKAANNWNGYRRFTLDQPWAKYGLFAAAALWPVFCDLFAALSVTNFAIRVCNTHRHIITLDWRLCAKLCLS